MANVKSCPACERTYSDATITFCLVDGAILSAPYDPQATLQMPASQVTVLKSPNNLDQKLDIKPNLIKIILLFIFGLIVGSVSVTLRPYSEVSGVHYEALISLLLLIFISLLLVSAKTDINLKKQIMIYLLQTFCLWSSFVIGSAVFYDSTNGMSLGRFVARGILTFSGWWLACAIIGSLLALCIYTWRKWMTPKSSLRA